MASPITPGQRFGRLVVVHATGRTAGKRKRIVWECACDCGARTNVSSAHLLRGSTKSCGCLRRENPGARGGPIRSDKRDRMLPDVLAMRDAGMPCTQIAAILRVSRASIHNWLRAARR